MGGGIPLVHMLCNMYIFRVLKGILALKIGQTIGLGINLTMKCDIAFISTLPSTIRNPFVSLRTASLIAYYFNELSYIVEPTPTPRLL